jgi:hypothetical protein
MSFLNNNGAEFLSARITKKGRNSIAKGNFNIAYFQIGDSEFDYSTPFTGLTGVGNIPNQKVLAPFDIDAGVKYPYRLTPTTGSTTFGIPIDDSYTETIRNVMGPAGFVSSFHEYDETELTGTTIECISDTISITSLSGSTYIDVTSGNTFQNCEFITISFKTLGGLDPEFPVITGKSTTLIYKITGITGNTLYLDRQTPNLTGLTGNAEVICNKCETEYQECLDINYSDQLNPWTLNVVWTQKPIGGDYGGTDESLIGYESNAYVSAKEFLGYTSTGQTFTNLTGGTLSKATSFKNIYDEEILVEPSEQRCVAIIHYSDLNNISIDPERFYKYDDYISTNNSVIDTVATDNEGNDISDEDYFEVYIPFISYHRNTGTTLGALFFMDTDDYYVKSTKNEIHQLLFRYLIDEQGNKVGKIFPNNKIIVFDDQELVALLDYRSNRRYTLPSPKAIAVPSTTTATNSLLSGTTGQTVWITYMFEYSGDTKLNSLPCNYFNKVIGIQNLPSQVGITFSGNPFTNLTTNINNVTTGFVANNFYLLTQLVDTGELPEPQSWKKINKTVDVGGNGVTFLASSGFTGITITINKTEYDAANLFDLEDFMGTNYLGDETFTTEPQFGDEQPFPGSIKLVRATDLEVMSFSINLPSSQFTDTQNPTYQTGAVKKITDVALLNSNKEVMVVCKASAPITRNGTQVLSVNLDF